MKFFAVIMAGGLGTRLWPLSRKKKPKQLHALVGKDSMIRDTFLRLQPKFLPEKIIISTVPEFVADIKKHLPEIPNENFIVEPFMMGNAAACGLVTKILNKRSTDSSAVFLPADAYIKDKKRFLDIISHAEKILEKHPDHIVQIGIKPTRPDTGMGYIQAGKKIGFTAGETKNIGVMAVKRFVEKPDFKTAEKYLKSGDYFWNAGIFAWKTSLLLDLIKQNLPDLNKGLEKIGESLGTAEEDTAIKKEYGKVEKTSIDYGIIEKTKKLLVIPADFGWSDVGTWETLHQVLLELNESKDISRGNHAGIETENCLVLSNSEKLIATVGLNNVVIIDTPDATLICDTKHSHKVKDLLEKLENKFL